MIWQARLSSGDGEEPAGKSDPRIVKPRTTNRASALKEVAAAYVGPTVQQQQHSTETPYTTGSGSDMGVGSFGIETTVLDIPDKAKAGYNTYPIQLKDKCGFNFLGFAPTNLALVLQPYEFVYADVSGADALGVTYPYTSTLAESYASSVIDGSYSSQCPSLVTSHSVTVEFQAAAGRFKLSMLVSSTG